MLFNIYVLQLLIKVKARIQVLSDTQRATGQILFTIIIKQNTSIDENVRLIMAIGLQKIWYLIVQTFQQCAYNVAELE